MATIDIYNTEKQRIEREELKKAGAPEEPEDTLTVKQIINNKEQSALLGDMIDHGDDPADKEIFTRLVSGKMEAGDIDRISELRKTFSERMRDAENIKSELTPELAKEMAKNSPEIRKIVETFGADGVTKAVHETIKKMAVNDPDTFKNILGQVKNVQSFKNGELKKLDEDVEERCKKLGINTGEALKALAIKDDKERGDALSKLMIKSKGIFSIFHTGKFKQLLSKKSDIEAALVELSEHKKNLGSVLAVSVEGNKDLLDAVSREIIGEPKKKEAVGMNDAKKEMPDDKKIKEAWEAAKKKECPKWGSMSEADKDVFRDHFADQYKNYTDKKFAKQGGFWSAIFGALFDGMFAGFDKKSLN
jgi:hypothetical protein